MTNVFTSTNGFSRFDDGSNALIHKGEAHGFNKLKYETEVNIKYLACTNKSYSS